VDLRDDVKDRNGAFGVGDGDQKGLKPRQIVAGTFDAEEYRPVIGRISGEVEGAIVDQPGNIGTIGSGYQLNQLLETVDDVVCSLYGGEAVDGLLMNGRICVNVGEPGPVESLVGELPVAFLIVLASIENDETEILVSVFDHDGGRRGAGKSTSEGPELKECSTVVYRKIRCHG